MQDYKYKVRKNGDRFLIFKRKKEVERLSELVFVSVQSPSHLYGISFALRYLYRDGDLRNKMQKNQTFEMKIKPKIQHHYKPKVSKVQLRPKNWNANPGKK